jgi:hypothetical protein
MPRSMLSVSLRLARLAVRLLAVLTATAIAHQGALAAALPAAPKTFDTRYAAPGGKTLTVAAGSNLQAALDQAQLGDTIVLEAGATFKGPFKLPNKTEGSGWIYVVSSHLSNLPSPGTRVSPANAPDMPKILAPNALSALNTVANSHHFRFVGIEFAPAAGPTRIYTLVTIGNADTSPATLPDHIVFDRCYVHGDPKANDRRGIEMDGAYVAVVDSYISDFQEEGADSQGLWAYNATGPLQIRNNYIQAAGENVMFGGTDSRAAALVPADIEISNNYFFKPLSLLQTKYTVKNLLEFKSAMRVRVTGNTFQNSPAAAQNGFAILLTPRSGGKAPWSVTSDIEIAGNTLINVGSGFNIAGTNDWAPGPTLTTERIVIRDNLVGVTGLHGADGRAFQFIRGGSDYTIDHNTIINTATRPVSMLAVSQNPPGKVVSNLVFTNNLSTRTAYGFFGSGVGEGNPALKANFSNWTFSKNVLVDRPAGIYPAGNFFPAGVAAVGFANYAGGNYTLAAGSRYKNAGTDGTDIGFKGGAPTNVVLPNPPTNLVVK